MNVFGKLQKARVQLHGTALNKSGKNNFAKFNYFELADFIPTVTKIFNEVGLCGVVSFTADSAYLTVYNVDGEKDDFITFTSPLVMASMDRVQPIQSLGATHTYLRRYLWLMAMEIVENDAVDAAEPTPPSPIKQTKAAAIPVPKAKVATNMNKGDWSISTDDVANNLPAVILAAEALLAVVETEEDLKAMFQINRGIFDQVQKASAEEYQALMSKFTATKEKILTKE